jgi:chromosome segregation ATPase
MAEISNELMYELLKKLNQRFDKVDHAIAELRTDNTSMRNQIHVLQGDVNSLRSSIGRVEDRLDRIENRLDLREFAEAQARFEPHP